MNNTFCRVPFTSLNVNINSYSTCCFGFILKECRLLHKESGNNLWDVWNCRQFQKLRHAVLDGNYDLCQKCPKVQCKRLDDEFNPDIHKEVMTVLPRVMTVSVNHTCNIYCLSCRKQPQITISPEESKRQYDLLQKVLDQTVHQLEVLILGGSGEIFFSPVYLQMLDWLNTKTPNELPNAIHIQSNGQLLVDRWSRWPNVTQKVTRINISIDAATKETYERIRRGASWDRLIRTLEFIRDKIKASNPSVIFGSVYTVYSENFHEMADFIDMMKGYGCDLVVLNELRRFHQTQEDFQNRHITNPEHPLHHEYLKALRDPRLRNNPMIRNDLNTELCQAISNP